VDLSSDRLEIVHEDGEFVVYRSAAHLPGAATTTHANG
jgi:hypothetical protein